MTKLSPRTIFSLAAIAALLLFSLLLSRIRIGIPTADAQALTSLAAAAPVELAPAVAPQVPDPLDDPQSFWEGITALRRTGGFWAAVGVAVSAIGGAILARMRPKPGEPAPDPKSWKARSLALLGVAVMLGGAGADLALGLSGVVGFLTALITAGALVWRAFNPERGEVLIAQAAKEAGVQ